MWLFVYLPFYRVLKMQDWRMNNNARYWQWMTMWYKVLVDWACCCRVSGNPGSVGSSVRMASSEEQAYLEKWKQLQKYVEPLKRMINKIDKDEGSTLLMSLAAKSKAFCMYFVMLAMWCMMWRNRVRLTLVIHCFDMTGKASDQYKRHP